MGMVAQLYKFEKITELYTYNEQILWYANYTSIMVLKKKSSPWAEAEGGFR